jgi:hypothetical protein
LAKRSSTALEVVLRLHELRLGLHGGGLGGDEVGLLLLDLGLVGVGLDLHEQVALS